MQSAINIGFTRKSRRGRPFQFRRTFCSLEERKLDLFESSGSQKEAMTFINLAYHFGRLNKEDYDFICFLEKIALKIHKNLDVKKLHGSPLNWHVNSSAFKSSFENDDFFKTEEVWKKFKKYFISKAPDIAERFFNILVRHHSYEELLNIKRSPFVMDVLKKGIKIARNFEFENYDFL